MELIPDAYDDAVVGAGIIGLAHAYHLARRGRKVVVFERGQRAQGASVRNFGMIWPIGQTAGPNRELALRSREIWLDMLQEAQIWHEVTGSLHLAYKPDEAAVLQEFASREAERYGYELLNASQTLKRSDAIISEGLMCALWSPDEVCVDPRTVVAALPGFLEERYGVRFVFNTAVSSYQAPRVIASGEQWHAERLWVCSGDDIQTLYPEVLEAQGFRRCKLQMMRSQPFGGSYKLGPMLAAGLTLRHYTSFQECPSLSNLKARFHNENPDFDKYGIHVMASQNGSGELTLGDSHEYGADITPFDRDEIDALILNYLHSFLNCPHLTIAQRWHGIYLKHPTDLYFVGRPSPGVVITTGVGGNGMTLSFGLAERVIATTLD
jgi:D-hydroxyproline dehydrogenase subunit beta